LLNNTVKLFQNYNSVKMFNMATINTSVTLPMPPTYTILYPLSINPYSSMERMCYTHDVKSFELINYVLETTINNSEEKIVRHMGRGNTHINDDKVLIHNILDLNINPININALRREIPLVNLYNYNLDLSIPQVPAGGLGVPGDLDLIELSNPFYSYLHSKCTSRSATDKRFLMPGYRTQTIEPLYLILKINILYKKMVEEVNKRLLDRTSEIQRGVSIASTDSVSKQIQNDAALNTWLAD